MLGTFAGEPALIQAPRASSAARTGTIPSPLLWPGGHRPPPDWLLVSRSARYLWPSSVTPMDRIYLAIIVSALLLLLGATGLYVTRTADLMPHARTVGVSGSR